MKISFSKICIGIFLINVCIKSFQILAIPPLLTYDELYYATQAQGYLIDGKELTGNVPFWSLTPAHAMYSELTGLMLTPGFLLFASSPLLAIKFLAIILGSLMPILLGLIVYRITKNKAVFLATAGIATINPWLFQFSRMSFDSLYSLFFYNLAIVLLLYTKGWYRLISVVPFFLGFFQYQGHKPLLIPLVAIVCCTAYLEDRSKKIFPLLIILIFSVILTGSYLYRLPQLSSSVRQEEFSLFDNQMTSEKVNYNRRLTLSNPLSEIIDNKYTVASREMLSRFLFSFDPQLLFIRGNAVVDTYTVLNSGFFYILDVILMLIGLCIVFSNLSSKKYLYAFPLLYIVIGTIPNVLRNGEVWITFRGAFVFTGLIMLIGIGLGSIISQQRRLLWLPIIGIYFVGSLVFFYNYLFRFPITATASNYFYDRILANYVVRNPNKQIVIVTNNDKLIFDSILTYNKQIDRKHIDAIRQAYSNSNFTHGNVTIQTRCPEVGSLTNKDTVLIVDSNYALCPIEAALGNRIEINSLIDSGTKYRIYNDPFCSNFSLNEYIYVTKQNFHIESLADTDFCQSFFSKK